MGKNKDKGIKDKKQKIPKPPLPHGWIVQVSKTYPDRVYYFNKFTRSTTWETPIATDTKNSADPKANKAEKRTKVKVSKKSSVPEPDKKELSGPEDYVDEDDDGQPFPSRSNLTSRQKKHEDTTRAIEVQAGTSRSGIDPTKIKGHDLHKGDYTKSRLEPSPSKISTAYDETDKISKNEDDLSSKNAKQILPVKPAIKNYDNGHKPVKKIKPSVRFAETASPKFSSDSDSEKSSPHSFHDSSNSQSEPEKHYSEIPLPLSPSEDSIYKKIELNSPLSPKTQSSSSTKTKSVSELYFGLDLPKNDVKTCRPFSVSDLKKANTKKSLVTKKFKSQKSEHKSEPNITINAVTSSAMGPKSNPDLPTSLPDAPSVSVLGKRKRLEEDDVIPLSQNDLISPLPQTKKVAASFCDMDEFITSDFIQWDNDEISTQKPAVTSLINKDNSYDIPVNSFPNLSNVLPSDDIKTASSSVSAPKPSSQPETPGPIYFSVKTITRKPVQTPIPVFEEDDTETPKIAKPDLSTLSAVCNNTSSANSVNFMTPTPSILSLDSVGMENTSSSSSTGTGVVSNIWENLLRPKPALAFPSSFGSTSHQPMQSFANLWENKPQHEHSDPVSSEEDMDMDWEPNSLEIPNKPQKEIEETHQGSTTLELDNLYSDYSQTTWYIIVDTNVLLYEIKYIEELRDTMFEGLGLPVIVIPWVALQELDNLKASKNKTSINQENISRARAAVSFILENLSSNHPRMKGQSFDEFSQHNYKNCTNNDDIILHFCSTLQKKECRLTLLTEDKNFRNKAIASKLEACSVRELQKKQSQQAPVLDETIDSQDISDPPKEMVSVQNEEASKADQIFCRTKVVLIKILKQVLLHGMKKFGKAMWQRIVVKKPPWTLNDILYCLQYHWIAVFKYELPPNAQNHIKELQKCFRTKQGYNHNISEITNLVETSLSLCSCIAQKDFLPQLVMDSNLELKKLLIACHGGELEASSNLSSSSTSHQSSNINTNSLQVDPSKRLDEELQEVQKHFTALWEKANSFCTKLGTLMSNAETSGSSSIDVEIEKNISTILRTVKQFIQLNQKLLVTTIIQPESREIQELHSILLSESSSDFDDESFSDEALCEFYHQRREELKMAQQSFETFVSIINNGIKFLMSKHK